MWSPVTTAHAINKGSNMKKLISLLVLAGLTACSGTVSEPDPNRSDERLQYEAQLLEQCHVDNFDIVKKRDWDQLAEVCDGYFEEKLGYTHTEAQESLKHRNIPD